TDPQVCDGVDRKLSQEVAVLGVKHPLDRSKAPDRVKGFHHVADVTEAIVTSRTENVAFNLCRKPLTSGLGLIEGGRIQGTRWQLIGIGLRQGITKDGSSDKCAPMEGIGLFKVADYKSSTLKQAGSVGQGGVVAAAVICVDLIER